MEYDPEIYRPIKMPGEIVEVGDPALLYDEAIDSEDEKKFQEAMDAIREAERQAWIELPRIILR